MSLKAEKDNLETILRDIDKVRHNLFKEKKEIEADGQGEWEVYSDIFKALEEARLAGNKALNIMTRLTTSNADLNPNFEKFFTEE